MHKVQAWLGFTTVNYKTNSETDAISSFPCSELSGWAVSWVKICILHNLWSSVAFNWVQLLTYFSAEVGQMLFFILFCGDQAKIPILCMKKVLFVFNVVYL